MRYDKMFAALERERTKYELAVKAIISQANQSDYDTERTILKHKAKPSKKVKSAAKGWTPERRAAQSRRIKAIMRAKRDAE